ncbi:MAG: CHASE2 domain-containing protein [Verrucomicrobiae bacterium]|nr:CHASE2 domain-containing protein [Verrucomicrobiae bacterium]
MRDIAEKILRLLQSKGFEAYFAGGCVRDQLLGITPTDYDIATSARPEEVEALFPGKSDLVGKSFGVVIVKEKGCHIEVATFRKDNLYIDGRRPESVTFSSVEQDAHRRDFTINALFFDPVTNRVLDFVGGQKDLENKMICAVGDPKERFAEDKLRLLRAVRIAGALNFQIEPNTWQALQAEASTINQVSPERIREEFKKWATGPNLVKGFDLLDHSGLLKVILPEVEALKGVEQPPQFHPEGDVFVHVRLMLSHLQQRDESLVWAVLLHDIGKPATYTVDATGRIRFNGHESVSAAMSKKILTRLRFSNAQSERIVAMVANHMSFKDAPQMRLSTLKRFLSRETFFEELELHRVDCLSSHGDLKIYEFLKQHWENFSQEEIKPRGFLNGKDVLAQNIAPGPEVGKLLQKAYDLQLEGKLKNRSEALVWLKQQTQNQRFSFLFSSWYIFGLIIFLLVLFLDRSGLWQTWENKQWDKLQSLGSSRPIFLTNIVAVEIDASTLNTYGEGQWPFSRLPYATLLQTLRGRDVRGVGFEMILSERDPNYTAFDNAFINQIQRTPGVVLAASALQTQEPAIDNQPIENLKLKTQQFKLMPSYNGGFFPLETFSTQAALGFNNLPIEPSNVLRNVPLAFRWGTNLYPSFILQCVLQNERLTPADVQWKKNKIIIERRGKKLFKIPVDDQCRMWIKTHPADALRIKRIGLDSLVLAASLPTTNRFQPSSWNMDQLKEKFVMVSRSATNIYQPITTAVGLLSPAEVQLLAWHAIYNKKAVTFTPNFLIWILWLSVIFFLLWFSIRNAWPWPLFAWFFFIIDWYIISAFLAYLFEIRFPVTGCLVATTLSLLVGSIYRFLPHRQSKTI